MAYEVDFLHVEPCPIAVVRRLAKQSELSRVVPESCGIVWNFLRAVGVKGAGRHVAVYLDGEINVEIGAEVPGPFESDGSVVASTTPGGWVATTAHIGPYNGLGGAHQAIVAWCAQNGRKLAGPNWEIYGHMTNDPAPPRTDVFYLLETSDDPLISV